MYDTSLGCVRTKGTIKAKSTVKTSRTAPSKRPIPARVLRKCHCYREAYAGVWLLQPSYYRRHNNPTNIQQPHHSCQNWNISIQTTHCPHKRYEDQLILERSKPSTRLSVIRTIVTSSIPLVRGLPTLWARNKGTRGKKKPSTQSHRFLDRASRGGPSAGGSNVLPPVTGSANSENQSTCLKD